MMTKGLQFVILCLWLSAELFHIHGVFYFRKLEIGLFYVLGHGKFWRCFELQFVISCLCVSDALIHIHGLFNFGNLKIGLF